MHMTSMFKEYKQMNDIYVYSIWTYENHISSDYYYEIVTYDVFDGIIILKG
jgi:hypothetical protein